MNVVEPFLSSIHVVAYLIEYDMKDSRIEKVRYLMGKWSSQRLFKTLCSKHEAYLTEYDLKDSRIE